MQMYNCCSGRCRVKFSGVARKDDENLIINIELNGTHYLLISVKKGMKGPSS